mmetsp:Transcript_12243/g.24899  ORF Transcript_12243/g.24899 Transcript_12243/m.24899 type:complete len:288 (-) Transcript_12243:139-1002(-)
MPRRERHGRDPLQLAFLLLLLSRLWEQYQRLSIKPGPITSSLVLLMITLHLVPELSPPYQAVCISSSHMWQLLQPSSTSSIMAWPFATLFIQRSAWSRATEGVQRLIMSTLLHVDGLHLYYNMASLLWKGGVLEDGMGVERFCFFVAYAVSFSGAIAVGLGWVAEELHLGTLHCAVGFSGVLYAMSALLALQDSPDRPTLVFGIPVRRRHAVWVEVVISSLLHSHVSFLGHLAGAAAGALWGLAPRLQLPGSSFAAAVARTHSRGAARFCGGGRVGSGSRDEYMPVD